MKHIIFGVVAPLMIGISAVSVPVKAQTVTYSAAQAAPTVASQYNASPMLLPANMIGRRRVLCVANNDVETNPVINVPGGPGDNGCGVVSVSVDRPDILAFGLNGDEAEFFVNGGVNITAPVKVVVTITQPDPLQQ